MPSLDLHFDRMEFKRKLLALCSNEFAFSVVLGPNKGKMIRTIGIALDLSLLISNFPRWLIGNLWETKTDFFSFRDFRDF